MSLPLISVITVTRNRRLLMMRKLESLARQTVAPGLFEVVVCVNGDGQATLQALEAADPPFDLLAFAFAENRGASVGRNACVRRARGHLLYLSDDDCMLRPETLARHLEVQREAPGVYQGGVRFHQEGGGWEDLLPGRRLRYWNFHGVNTSLPGDLFRAAGGFPEWLSTYGHEDVLLGFHLERAGHRLRPLCGAEIDHIGSNPVSAGDRGKARSAGSNAAKIVVRFPEMAFQLGVHPWLLAIKKLLLGPLIGGVLAHIDPGRVAYERAYLAGALEQKGGLNHD